MVKYKNQMKKLMASILVVLLVLCAVPTSAFAADSSVMSIELLQRYYNAVILSSKSRGVSDYALSPGEAVWGDDEYYHFVCNFSNSAVLEGLLDEDGEVYGVYISGPTDTMSYYTKYVIFATISATQFSNGDTKAYQQTKDICDSLNLLGITYSRAASTSKSVTVDGLVYSFSLDSNKGTVSFSVVPA